MKTDWTFALDVGGTYIKACVIENKTIINDTICEFPSYANEDKETIINHLANIILFLYERHNMHKTNDHPIFNGTVLRIGFAFPGPFDYEQGISYIRGLDKFESLYGVCIRTELLNALNKLGLTNEFKDIDIRFENDGRLFGLGTSTLYPNGRLICLTIGTGLGSVFIDQCSMVIDDVTVPEDGYLYKQLYKGKMVDDYFSRRGILKKASEKGIDGNDIDVKDLAYLARQGIVKAKTLFDEFGLDLAEMLMPYIQRFCPQQIIIGGQIAKSFDLFEESMKEKLDSESVSVISLEDALHYTFLGIDHLFSQG